MVRFLAGLQVEISDGRLDESRTSSSQTPWISRMVASVKGPFWFSISVRILRIPLSISITIGRPWISLLIPRSCFSKELTRIGWRISSARSGVYFWSTRAQRAVGRFAQERFEPMPGWQEQPKRKSKTLPTQRFKGRSEMSLPLRRPAIPRCVRAVRPRGCDRNAELRRTGPANEPENND